MKISLKYYHNKNKQNKEVFRMELEIKINKEINAYKENLFFGLSARQFICSVLAIVIAVGIYFCFKDIIGKETVSWLCMVAASPIAAIGFFKYNGLTAEKLVWAIIKSEIIYAGKRVYKADNYYLDILNMQPKKKVISDVKIFKKQYTSRKRNGKSTQKCTSYHSNKKNI